MKKSKLVLIICSCLCIVLSGAILAIAFSHTTPKHEHTLGDVKTYHICNDHIYYTRLCLDGCEVAFETKATFADVLLSVEEDEKIILDENVTITQEMYVKSFVGTGTNTQDLELDINLDLNGFTLSNNVATSEYDSMFMFNANRGKINFNVKNGKLYSQSTSYIFRFRNNQYSGDNVTLNIDNVECTTSGIQTTPLFGGDTYNMVVNANNCKFVSKTTSTQKGDYGVGVYINSSSEFNFNNCYFEGGDAVYVRNGVVNLTSCQLVNEGLVAHASQSTSTFSAVGACLTADSYTSSKGVSEFTITIKNCLMQSNASFKMIYVIETEAESGLGLSVSDNSLIDVQSCIFNNNPTALTIPQYDIVQYPNGEAPTNNGTQIWTCGEVAATANE